jgi:Tfp pilus assembly protein PilF
LFVAIPAKVIAQVQEINCPNRTTDLLLMSSAYVKGRLKAAREQIAAKDWDKAAATARDALSFEASNYNALVFLAVALSNLGNIDESEELYLRAFEEHPELPLAERVWFLRPRLGLW